MLLSTGGVGFSRGSESREDPTGGALTHQGEYESFLQQLDPTYPSVSHLSTCSLKCTSLMLILDVDTCRGSFFASFTQCIAHGS